MMEQLAEPSTGKRAGPYFSVAKGRALQRQEEGDDEGGTRAGEGTAGQGACRRTA